MQTSTARLREGHGPYGEKRVTVCFIMLLQLTLADIQHNVGHRIRFSNDKLKRDLISEDLISPRDMARDMYDSLVEHGLISKSN
jgi:hypothetical protein